MFAADLHAVPAERAGMPDVFAERRLNHAREHLPPSQRTALRLTRMEELTLTEASQKSGMTIGALKVAVHRGLRLLRQRLGGMK